MERQPAIQPGDITVILPTKNEEHNIVSFLASLPPAVSLIVTDASDDLTSHLIRITRPNHTTILHSNAHIAEARNIGAHTARTPWLLFTDADVIFAADYFERVQRYGAAAAVYGPKLSLQAHQRYYRWFSRGQHLLAGLRIPAVSGSNLLIQRRAFLATGGFDQTLSCNEDSEYGWRLARQKYAVRFAPDLIVYEHDHRRLERGVLQKTIHSIVRCSLLYTGLMPGRLRTGDWGYWS